MNARNNIWSTSYVSQWLLPLIPLIIWAIERFFNLDIIWFRTINQVTSSLPDLLWTGLSILGNGWGCFALAFPLILFAPRLLMAGILSGIFTGIFSRVAKLIADTPRPAGLLDPNSFHIIDQPLLHSALPSGHTMTVFGIACAFYYCSTKKYRRYLKWLFVLAIGTGVSRIAVGAHWPEDVLVGSSLGFISGIWAATLAKLIPEHYLKLNQWPAVTTYVGSAVCFYVLITQTLDFVINQPIQWILAGIIAITWIKLISLVKYNQYV